MSSSISLVGNGLGAKTRGSLDLQLAGIPLKTALYSRKWLCSAVFPILGSGCPALVLIMKDKKA
ncbi:MAG: hypothetical protein ACLVAA_04910 [Ruthenibacterium sp.]